MSHSRDADRQPHRVANQTITGTRRILAGWRRNLRLSGVRQIDQAIAALEIQLATSEQPLIDQLISAGQRRELYAARWLVQRLLQSSSEPDRLLPEQPADNQPLEPDRPRQALPDTPAPLVPQRPIVLTQPVNSIRSPQAALFQTTVAKLQARLQNCTHTALEIDFLKEEKKRELLYLVLQKLEETLEALRTHLACEQLEAKRSAILQDVWQATVTAFFGKYYAVQMAAQPIDVVTVLLQDREIVETAILAKIPLFPEFLAHLLFQMPLAIDDTDYAAGSVEAMARMELLLQNVMFQVANAVMQPLLNRFGDVVAIKQTFYDQRLLSSREIERFRNDLSWKYRTDRLFAEPIAIFESQYRLLILTDDGISQTAIYAPRNEALAELSGIPFWVTLILETRDAIAPRVRAAVSFLGKGVVYVLTEVIGRGIGLIGRGMIKGVGNALQDTKPRRNSERWR